MIDNTWANAHSSALADLNGDGQAGSRRGEAILRPDGHRSRRTRADGHLLVPVPPGAKGTVEWIRHIVDYGGRAGGGLQMVVEDIDGDGDRDVITAGKTGLFLSENLTKTARAR